MNKKAYNILMYLLSKTMTWDDDYDRAALLLASLWKD